jgi:repressor LexA
MSRKPQDSRHRPGTRNDRSEPPVHTTPTPDRESAILDFIADALREHGRPPTIREIGTAFGITSTNGVRYYLDRLEKSGRIRRDRWTSRGIELQALEGRTFEDDVAEGRVTTQTPRAPVPAAVHPSNTRRNTLEIPLLGRVAAGAPILAEENIEDTIVVDGAFVRPGKHFALRVRGDSMKNAGILDGDVVIVRHEAPVRSGEIGVVLVGDEATVKRIFPRRDKVVLLPENEDYEPIEVRPGDPDVRVAGKVVGVFRKLG